VLGREVEERQQLLAVVDELATAFGYFAPNCQSPLSV
jgi:hypothetical protein